MVKFLKSQPVLSAAFAALTIYLNALIVPVLVLLVFMVLDYATGMVRAWRARELSSKVGVDGIIKKVGYMVLVVVAMGVDYLIWSGLTAVNVPVPCQLWFGMLVTIWLIINEMISILENLGRIGVPIPEFLKKILGRLKNSVEKTETGKEDVK